MGRIVRKERFGERKMSKKSVVFFIFLLVSLVLPFLFYFAWQGPAQSGVSKAKAEGQLLDGGEQIERQVKEPQGMEEQTSGNDQVVSASNPAALAEKYGEDSAAYVTFAPGVTAQMQNAQYWLAQAENPREVLWDQEDIKSFHQQVLNKEGMAYNIFNPEFRSNFQSELILGESKKREPEEGTTALGEAMQGVGGGTMQTVDATVKAVTWNDWGYGICVTRSEIKELPQEAPVGSDAYFDENLLTTARTNTPVLVDGQTADGAYYHVIAYDYQGWTLAENIALCSGLEEWEQVVERSGWAAFAVTSLSDVERTGESGGISEKAGETMKNHQSILIVTVPRLRLELTGELLTMGTMMHLLKTEEAQDVLGASGTQNKENSVEYGANHGTEHGMEALAGTWGCYVAELAGRDEVGMYEPRYVTIPYVSASSNQEQSSGMPITVSTEYLEFTREKLLKQMFLFAGQAYGWGGSHDSVDCSGLVQDVMASFGILFPRDAKEQSQISARASQITFTEDMDAQERKEILNTMNPGDLLYFPGHIMFYLGEDEGEHYVYSAVGSMKEPGEDGAMLQVRRVVINSLSMERKNGKSWLEALEEAVLWKS